VTVWDHSIGRKDVTVREALEVGIDARFEQERESYFVDLLW